VLGSDDAASSGDQHGPRPVLLSEVIEINIATSANRRSPIVTTAVFAVVLVAVTIVFFGFALFTLLRLPHLLSLEQRYRSAPICAADGGAAAQMRSAAGGSCRARVSASITDVSRGDVGGSPDTLSFHLADGTRAQADVANDTHGFTRGQQVTLESYRGDVTAIRTSFGWIATTNDPDSQVQGAWSFPFLILAGALTLIPTVVFLRRLTRRSA
jgi:hypothetical protein